MAGDNVTMIPENQVPDFNNATLKPSTAGDILSQETADDILFTLECVVYPIVTLFGVIGNALSLVVLFQKRIFSATVILLIGLTVADGLFLVSNFMRKSRCIFERLDPEHSSRFYTVSFAPLFYLKTSFGRVSTLLVVAISVERFLAVHFPLKVKRLSTKFRMSAIVLAIYIFTFGCLSPLLAQVIIVERGGKLYSTMSKFYVENKHFYNIYNKYVLIIAFRWIPKLLVLIFNSLILSSLFKHRKTSADILGPLVESRQTSDQRRITKMLLVVAIVFVVCLLPGDAFVIASSISSEFSIYGKYRHSYLVFSDVSLLFEMFNSSVNFLIYMAYSRKFSAVYMALFCPCVKKKSSDGFEDRSGQELYRMVSSEVDPDVSMATTNTDMIMECDINVNVGSHRQTKGLTLHM